MTAPSRLPLEGAEWRGANAHPESITSHQPALRVPAAPPRPDLGSPLSRLPGAPVASDPHTAGPVYLLPLRDGRPRDPDPSHQRGAGGAAGPPDEHARPWRRLGRLTRLLTMAHASARPPAASTGVQTPSRQPPGTVCAVCRVPLRGQQRVACSGRHRAEAWRVRQEAERQRAQAARDEAVRIFALEVSRLAAELIRRTGVKP
jgi:hypothetical protein